MPTSHGVADAVVRELHDVSEHYGADETRLESYAAVAAAYAGLLGAFVVAFRRSNRSLPRAVPAADVVLLGAATFKLSRLLTRAKVTAFIRAPFTRYRGPGAPAEVSEEPRGTGAQRAVGELLACPFCSAQWLATGLACGYVVNPDAARVVAAGLAAVVVSDGLQYANAALQQRYG